MMEKILQEILKEVDDDIRNALLQEISYPGIYSTEPAWALLRDPALTAINWQLMRFEREKIKSKIRRNEKN